MGELEEFLEHLQQYRTPPSSSLPALAQETDDDLEAFLPYEVPATPISSGMMPDLLVRSLSVSSGWSYHPRSDRHSVIKCLGLLFDLARACPKLHQGLIRKDVVFGINTPVFGKALDLAIGPPGLWSKARAPRFIDELAKQCRMEMPADAHSLQGVCEGVVRTPYLAVEAKAVMTDHRKALATLSDQLERFRHRVQERSITVGLVLVNASDSFRSPGRNRHGDHVSYHRPSDTQAVWDTVLQLPKREDPVTLGFDSMIVVAVSCPNDGSPVKFVRDTGYELEIKRLASLYTARCP